ncbi:hypothetical protein Patl1_28648 [Pistacia atlantica]|uniref:Uncharacterized protein n=1 Tax=Pistacia atlantica TaxID=434234 RepID=A0ACC1BCA2_9ROSI|nr:hypothetical protein Patl1_28648 [Pistacia atlantica]
MLRVHLFGGFEMMASCADYLFQKVMKTKGKQADISQFRAQLDTLGLKIIQVTADGNCFFRALADQLEGNEEEHEKYRSLVVQYIVVSGCRETTSQVDIEKDLHNLYGSSSHRYAQFKIQSVVLKIWGCSQKNRETFEPFIEDDVPFDEYCLSMEEDGTWAGHMELQAASLVTRCNICIHRVRPFFSLMYFYGDLSVDYDLYSTCHLVGTFGILILMKLVWFICESYHDGEHYNSVRLKEDPCNGSARPIIIKVDADLSSASHQAKTAASKSKGGSGPNVINAGSIKMVMAGTGCENAERVEQVLLEVGGDTDAAIEFLVAEQGAEDYTVENNLSPCHMDISHGDNENGNSEQLEVEPVKKTCEQDLSSNSLKRAHDDVRFQPDDKKIPRNKVCPCGSKKKYKACCGSAAGRSTKFVV